MFAKITDSQFLYKDKAASDTPGNLFAPIAESTLVECGWHAKARSKIRLIAGGLAATVPLVLVWRRFQNGQNKKALLS